MTGTANGISKALTVSEIQIIFIAGLKFFPIYQAGGASNAYFTSTQGTKDAEAAVKAAENLGIPSDTIIHFAVDYDALDGQINSNVLPYFQSISSYFSNFATTSYRIGIYGSRNICTRIYDAGYAISSFVGDMSSGYSGNLGYQMPDNWAFDQFYTTSVGSGNGLIEIDKDSNSGRNTGVNYINLPTDDEIEEAVAALAACAYVIYQTGGTATGQATTAFIAVLGFLGLTEIKDDNSDDSETNNNSVT